MALDTRAAWRTWRTYRGTGPVTQAFIAARMAVAPLGPLEPEFKMLSGRILSVGCGHGAVDRYVAEVNSDIRIEGFDLDAERIAIANATAHRSPRFTATVADATKLEGDGTFDGALFVDLLHHVPYDHHSSIAKATFRLLRAGGVCLIKEMARTPRRQWRWNLLHDRIVTGDETNYCRDPDELASIFADAGFEIADVHRVKRLRIYPQYVVVARKPVTAT